jgi:hypothetical protein
MAINPGTFVGSDGLLRIPVDGQPWTAEEMYAISTAPAPLKCPNCSSSKLEVQAAVTEFTPEGKNVPVSVAAKLANAQGAECGRIHWQVRDTWNLPGVYAEC